MKQGTNVPFQYNDGLSGYGNISYKDRTAVRSSYFYDENPYTGKTTLYWDVPSDSAVMEWIEFLYDYSSLNISRELWILE